MMDTITGLLGVIRPSLPKRVTLIALVVGFLVGLAWAYVISPTVFYNADPHHLERGWQKLFVELAGDSFANTGNTDRTREILSTVDNPTGLVQELEAEGEAPAGLAEIAAEAQPGTRSPRPNIIASLVPWIIGPILIVILGGIGVLAWNLLLYPFVEPMISRARKRGGPESDADRRAQAETEMIKQRKAAEATMQKVEADTTLGEPIIQKMSLYKQGFGNYDDSFAIEDANDTFFGECGAAIAETIGVGDPQQVTAIEIWLFDKEDFVRTLTSLFVSEHAMNDPALKASLEPKGDLVLAQPGATITMETNTLKLVARIVDMQYGTGATPPNSFFETMSIQIAVWHKQGAAQTSPTPTAPAAAAPSGGYAPPPAAPSMPPTTQPSAAPSMPSMPPASTPPQSPPPQPLQPPPAAPPRPPQRQDDDPFGGTGDFSPTR